jgi:hypothetical protein
MSEIEGVSAKSVQSGRALLCQVAQRAAAALTGLSEQAVLCGAKPFILGLNSPRIGAA